MPTPRVLPRHRAGDPRRAALGTLVALVLLASLPALAHAQAPDTVALRLPDDAVYQSRVGADSAVIFRHGTHVALASQRCTACHPQRFRILSPTLRITHAEMDAGRSCGGCHDGEHAFDTKAATSCALCHVGRVTAAAAVRGASPVAAGSPAYRGPKPITYSPGEVSPGTVTFLHATHAKGGCTTCHPRLFAMKTTPAGTQAKPKGDMHAETACGACHDGKKTFAVDDERSCAKCHRESAR